VCFEFQLEVGKLKEKSIKNFGDGPGEFKLIDGLSIEGFYSESIRQT